MSKAKQLRQREESYRINCEKLLLSDMKDADAAKKILNIRKLTSQLTNVDQFEALLQLKWNLPTKFFTVLPEIVDNATKAAETKAAIRSVVDTTITVSDYLEAIHFLEKAYDINAWADHLETMVDSFTMLRFLARSTKAGTEYMLELQVRIQEDIWNEKGDFYSWSQTTVEHDRGDDYSYALIEKWRACYHELLKQAYALYKTCKEHNEFLDLPRQILEEFASLIMED